MTCYTYYFQKVSSKSAEKRRDEFIFWKSKKKKKNGVRNAKIEHAIMTNHVAQAAPATFVKDHFLS